MKFEGQMSIYSCSFMTLGYVNDYMMTSAACWTSREWWVALMEGLMSHTWQTKDTYFILFYFSEATKLRHSGMTSKLHID